MANIRNNTGRRGLQAEEILLIRSVYDELKSIEKTSRRTGYCSTTVHKYCRDKTCTSKHSRDNGRVVIQTTADGKHITYPNAHVAAAQTAINYSGIIKVLNHQLPHISKSIFGFGSVR